MTTPADPVSLQPTSPDVVSPQVPAPAPDGSPTDQDIRDLVGTLAKQSDDGISYATIRKAYVSGVHGETNPPTINVQFPTPSGGTSVDITNVRYLDSYSPNGGDNIVVIKQGQEILALGQIKDNNSTSGGVPNGWQSSGDCRFRLVVDNGDFKVQMQGSFAVSGSNLFVLPAAYRPLADRQFVVASNNNNGYNRVNVSWTTGQVSLVSPQFHQPADPVDPGDSTTFNDAGGSSWYGGGWGSTGSGGADGHYHATDVYAHSHYTGAHNHGIVGSHAHGVTVNMPSRVWFDNCEFFL